MAYLTCTESGTIYSTQQHRSHEKSISVVVVCVDANHLLTQSRGSAAPWLPFVVVEWQLVLPACPHKQCNNHLKQCNNHLKQCSDNLKQCSDNLTAPMAAGWLTS